MLQIDILTIFPDMFTSVLAESMIKRGLQKELFSIHAHDLRKWSNDKHGKVDDTPYGGGAGMVMTLMPIYNALQELRTKESHVVLLSASGEQFTQKKAHIYSDKKHIIFICGHYEGIDARVSEYLIDEEISIGKFVLTGGEIPTMAIIDATIRLIPGVLGNEESIKDESFSIEREEELLEYPQYTKPLMFNDMSVPDVLLSGNHKLINEWRESHRKRPV